MKSYLDVHASNVSNALGAGEFQYFEPAISALKSAYHCEMAGEVDQEGRDFWQKYIAECELALEIYSKHPSNDKAAIAQELRGSGLEDYAEALETGDYSGFAY